MLHLGVTLNVVINTTPGEIGHVVRPINHTLRSWIHVLLQWEGGCCSVNFKTRDGRWFHLHRSINKKYVNQNGLRYISVQIYIINT